MSAIVLGFYTLTEMHRVRNTDGTQLLVTMWSGEALIHYRWNNKTLHLPNLMTENVSVFYNCMFLVMYSSICSTCLFVCLFYARESLVSTGNLKALSYNFLSD